MTHRRIILAALLAIGCADSAGGGSAGAPAARAGGGAGQAGAAGGRASEAGSAGHAVSGSGGAPDAGEPTGGARPPAAGADAGSAGSAGARADSGAGGSSAMDAGSAAELPAELLDLEPWKLTLPTGDEGDPTEILQPELSTFALEPYFHVNAAGDGVVFRAHAGGVTTGNSSYPRSELREMAGDGSEMAAWSTSEGTHTLTLVQTITHLPEAKPHVVAGQVHDADDDVLMIRLEDTNLFVEGGGEDLGTLEPSYVLRTRFTVKIEASGGRIRVFYEDMATPRVDIERDLEGCYFKAGAYTQSNPERGDAPDAYGEVVIHELSLTHEP